MIIAENKQKKVVSSHDFDSVSCTIDAEDMRYVASLLRNNYSNTQLAVIREISANALDANLEANSKRKIEVSLPTRMQSNFCVRDFGGGLSKEDVFGLYSKYGKSTKRQSNNYIGAFGIGKFAPLSYGENFTCVSYHGGMKTSYNIFVNEEDDTKIVELHQEPSAEPTGLCIEVAISDSDIEKFRDTCQKFFKFFPEKDMPKFLGVESNFIEKQKILLSSKKDDWFFLESSNTRYYGYGNSSRSHVIMGRVSYPLDPNAIDVKNYVKDDRQINIIESLLQESNFYLRVPLGCVKLHHSREALEYNKPTQKFIVQLMLEVVQEIQAIAKEKLADSADLFQAKANYAKIINSMPDSLQRAFRNSFEWNGIKIDSFGFSRPYGMTDDLVLTQTEKISDRDARNGFKVKSHKVSNINCRDNVIFLVQDIESSHGNNLRARTLFNQDSDLEVIYFIYPKTDTAQSVIDNEWNFNLIDDSNIKYCSNVAKEKPQIGVRKGSGSRANIPLFEMKDDKGGYGYRNIDYWSNVADDISALQSQKNPKGLVNGKYIYIPIKNYKIDHKSLDLDAVYKRASGIRKLAQDKSQEKSFRLFGVRSGDVSKLDKSLWVSFFDFYAGFAKTYLKLNLKSAKTSYGSIMASKDSELHTLMNEVRYDIGAIFNNNNVKLDSLGEDHLMVQSKQKYNTIIHDNESPTCRSYIAYLLVNGHQDWVDFNFNGSFSAKQMKKDINAIISTYPMLTYVGSSVSNYRGNRKVYQQIIDYIQMVDKN